MKDHVKVDEFVYINGLSIDEVISKLRKHKLVDARLEIEDYGDARIVGWRPMTPKEKQAADLRRKKARDAAAARKASQELKDRRQLERLAEKLGVELPGREVKT